MKAKLSLLILLTSLLSTACAREAESKNIYDVNKVSGTFQKADEISTRDSNLGENIPNTEWYAINMEGVIINLTNYSKNEFIVDDGIGLRRAALLIESQRNRGITYPVFVFLSKDGPMNCAYDVDVRCVINIQFSETEKWPYPAKIVNNSVRSVVTIFDDDFLDKLKEFDELIVELPVIENKTESMVFDVRGFKQKFLEFE